MTPAFSGTEPAPAEDPRAAPSCEAPGWCRLPRKARTTLHLINLAGYEISMRDDGWTAVTAAGSLSAQFEHMVYETGHGFEVLTLAEQPLAAATDALLRG